MLEPDAAAIREIFLCQLPSSRRARLAAWPSLERTLQELVRRARAAWPGIALAPEIFVAHDQIAVLHGVHRATVARWIARVRQAILGGTRFGLRRRLEIEDAEVESILRLVDARAQVSVGQLLGAWGRGTTGQRGIRHSRSRPIGGSNGNVGGSNGNVGGSNGNGGGSNRPT
jgi:uncharacterized membrane protein YgcG